METEAKKEILDALEAQGALIDSSIKTMGESIESTGTEVKGVREDLMAVDTRLKEVEGKIHPKGYVPGLEDEKQKFSLLKAVVAISKGNWSEAGFEKEIFEATAKDMSQGSDSAGGYVVPTQYVADIIEMLYANSTVVKAGATVVGNLSSSPVDFPKQTGGATGYWVGENEAITGSDLTLGQVQMTPKVVGALVKMSNRLLKMSNPSAEAMVKRDVAQTLALMIDLACLRGTGANGQPTGIANTGSILTYALGTNGDTFRIGDVAQMEYKLDLNNSLRGKLGIITHPRVVNQMKTERIANYSGQTEGNYVMLPMTDQQLKDSLGYGFEKTTQLPVNLEKGNSGAVCTEVYFGNWEELLLGNWGGLEIQTSTETSDAFSKNQTWVRVLQEVDVAVRHPESFCLCNDAITT